MFFAFSRAKIINYFLLCKDNPFIFEKKANHTEKIRPVRGEKSFPSEGNSIFHVLQHKFHVLEHKFHDLKHKIHGQEKSFSAKKKNILFCFFSK